MSTPNAFIISRMFDAPCAQVFDAWTQTEKMAQWWGPKGAKILKAQMDLRPGGMYHYCMTVPFSPEPMWGKFLFREIDRPSRLVFLNSFSDEKGDIAQHPLAPTWPRQTLTVVTFEETAPGKTKLTIHWTPYEATVEEIQTFTGGMAGMNQGWGGTLDQLAVYLAQANDKAA